jgi:putative intracellular protease/amidase
MSKTIALVLTNIDRIPDNNKQTGWYLPEVAHPYYTFIHNGYKVLFVTPKGGHAPVDQGSIEAFKNDKESVDFINDKEIQKQLDHTVKPSEVDPNSVVGIFYAGGHGPMWDTPNDEALAKLCAQIYEQNKPVAAVCHGPCGIVNVKQSNGDYLLKGKKVCGFTNAEEDAVKGVVPFSLEDKMKERGGVFVPEANWAANVQQDGRLLTGQNPASAKPLAEAFVNVLKQQGL